MLHLISTSPFKSSVLDRCLRLAQPGQAIVFIEEGVYILLADHKFKLIQTAFQKIALLKPDVIARGLHCPFSVSLIEYTDLVQWTVDFHPIQSWR